MGKGRDKKKKKREAGVSAKNKSKPDKSNKKSNKSSEFEEPEEDIDSLLNAFEKEQKEKFQVTEETNAPSPSRRANASLSANPVNPSELLLFGGEFFDGQKVHMFNDLYRYNIDKNEWKRITSPNSPGPRSSHQICVIPSGRLFLFGGKIFISDNPPQRESYLD
jgi:hypothetical protein